MIASMISTWWVSPLGYLGCGASKAPSRQPCSGIFWSWPLDADGVTVGSKHGVVLLRRSIYLQIKGGSYDSMMSIVCSFVCSTIYPYIDICMVILIWYDMNTPVCCIYFPSWFATLGAKLPLRWCSPCVSTCWEERVTAEAVAFLSQEWWTCSWKLRCPACVPCCPTSTWKTSRRSAVLFQLNELVVEKWWVRWDAAGVHIFNSCPFHVIPTWNLFSNQAKHPFRVIFAGWAHLHAAGSVQMCLVCYHSHAPPLQRLNLRNPRTTRNVSRGPI